ncbi:BREX-1 system adenine-specific DNA-methyltransferase PglX [Allobranchiibius sp. GilTou73]|uniref:BREX-1 system adenine-specific DNA-methyltransferase PglX n=1 Tax=Allobranchiibius sp. GilTou73 TaxID=2904523 RepID=UPI001F46A988|nr:BREX-1 system adenine-specific DNA-methyltransferase PglX [Allobranchiibius sp. GilTou73]UIJ35078.1 BREX-1 system adenine-specific DNA-methyltransferase PglX [Allobranchiibius sp. GilTou73]
METAPLKSFATSARTELIREVGARITAVLAPGAPERVEQASAVTALERAIAGAGGDGKAHVADRVAYTWFNRIIALRFMDANGYTGIGVVSPAADQVGQPEVLGAAKRGQVDKDVVKGTHLATITGLLDGTRQPRLGVDAQAEAYALLLADYCRFWNAAMPFMFEREGDYTELLIPATLLADDSVLSRSVTVLTKDVCQDVEVIGWLYQFYISERKGEVLAGFKKNKKAGADEIPAATQLFTPHWIVRYLVENSLGKLWMLNRPASGLASHMEYYIAPVDEETDFLKISTPEELKVIDPACGSGHMLTYAFDLLYAIYEEEGYAPSEIPGLILANNLYGTEIDPRAGALAAFALTMKAASKRKLFLKKAVEPNVCVLDPISFSPDELNYLVTRGNNRDVEQAFWNQFAGADTLGSLVQPDPHLLGRLSRHLRTVDHNGDLYRADAIEWAFRVLDQAEILSRQYSVVVANPPYLGDKTFSEDLRKVAGDAYNTSKFNTYSMFMERAVSLTDQRGFAGLIVLHSWMSGAKYESFRERIFTESPVVSLAHLGAGAFDSISGEVVSTAAFILQPSGNRAQAGVFVDLTSQRGEGAKSKLLLRAISDPADANRYQRASDDFDDVPGRVVAYHASDAELCAFRDLGSLGDLVDIRQGMATTDNNRFLRQWFEVPLSHIAFGVGNGTEALESGNRWFPYNKGGTPRAWYGNQDLVVNWEDDGREIKANIVRKYPYLNGKWGFVAKNPDFYFRPGLTYSALAGGGFAVRVSPPGFIFDTKGSCVFPTADLPMPRLAALLNSSVVAQFLGLLAPTLDFNLASLKSIPVPEDLPPEVDEFAQEAVSIARADWDDFETSWDFTRPSVVAGVGSLRVRIDEWRQLWASRTESLRKLHQTTNELVAHAYGLSGSVDVDVSIADVSLVRNVVSAYGPSKTESEYAADQVASAMSELVSYAVGCMFGRYSLSAPGLILAEQSATLQDYFVKVPSPTFAPNVDNVIPIVDGDWFEDDVVGLFRKFLRTAFGVQHLEENLKFVTESLGVRNLRDHFITKAGKSKFYEDHVQRYRKRPIYWLFSSPKGSFNALIYMHRYTPSTVSTVLTYLREYVTKLESALQQAERAGNAKEADRLRKILVELNEYEHDTLYPKASQNVAIDLDDGVKVNYPKFGTALKKINGLESSGG